MPDEYTYQSIDGWITVYSTPQDVSHGTVVDVIFRDGTVLIGAPYGVPPARGYGVATFENNDSPTDVMFYRMYTEMSEGILHFSNVYKFVPVSSLMEEQDKLFDDQQERNRVESSSSAMEDKKEILITRFLEMMESIDLDEVENIDINTSLRYYNGISESHYISADGE